MSVTALTTEIDRTPVFRPVPATATAPPTGLDRIDPIDWLALADTAPPPREFIIKDWLAPGHVTMFVAEGGFGKTTLALQLALSTALNRPWLGLPVTGGPALMLAAEDDDDELHRRVCRFLGILASRKADLAGQLFLQGRVGMANQLLAHPKGRPAEPLPLLLHIEEQAKAIGARLIVIDNAAQFFGGEENARAEVTAFINALNGVAQRLRAAVLLLGHPPKNGADYSGSTAWHAVIRCLWTLKRVQEADDEAEPDDILVLCRVKANYAKNGEEIRLKWVDGVLRLAEEPVSAVDAAFARHNAQAAFLAALDALTEQRRAASHSKRATNYAPKLMVEAGLAGSSNRRDLERAMNELMREGRVKAGMDLWRGSDRKWVTGLARAGQPQ